MPGLADIACATHTVEVSGGVSVIVRGLYFEDIVAIFREHKEAARSAFDAITSTVKAGGEVQVDDIAAISAVLAQEGPGFVATIIAHAADEPGMSAAAARLPFTKQVELLEAIFRLTLEREGGLPNVVASVTRVAEALTTTINRVSH